MSRTTITDAAPHTVTSARPHLPRLEERVDPAHLTPEHIGVLSGFLGSVLGLVDSVRNFALPAEGDSPDPETDDTDPVQSDPLQSGLAPTVNPPDQTDDVDDIDGDIDTIVGDVDDGVTPQGLDDLEGDIDALTGSGADLLQADVAWMKDDAKSKDGETFDADWLHEDLARYQARRSR